MRAACFPADEPPDPSGLARATAMAGALTVRGPAVPAEGVVGGRAWVAPSTAAVRTAVAMGLEPVPEPALAEADHGRWRGLPYARVAEEEPEALARWLTDPHATPHGGESLAALAARVAGWLEGMRAEPAGVVVCDVGVIRAALGHALGLPPPAAARFDLAPLSTTELTATRDGWRVAHVNRKVPS
ncbi:histidine phosphatase family protein [Nonomuraea aridisoli]|uniref:Histidine phosphatase family protein n=2 Tax=Nonomuraea aridisoli TaxID=2070368 RepID=A0A2W2EWX8_9ACTN|nr:histidine phosphatase family protein [Nonomuraea aridisoli]